MALLRFTYIEELGILVVKANKLVKFLVKCVQVGFTTVCGWGLGGLWRIHAGLYSESQTWRGKCGRHGEPLAKTTEIKRVEARRLNQRHGLGRNRGVGSGLSGCRGGVRSSIEVAAVPNLQWN